MQLTNRIRVNLIHNQEKEAEIEREKNHTKSFHVCLIGKYLPILVGGKYKAAIVQVRQMNIEHLSE